jgi:hypothetical protein
MGWINKFIKSKANVIQWSEKFPGQYTTLKPLLNHGTLSCECAPGWHMHTRLPPVVLWWTVDILLLLFISGSWLRETENTGSLCETLSFVFQFLEAYSPDLHKFSNERAPFVCFPIGCCCHRLVCVKTCFKIQLLGVALSLWFKNLRVAVHSD